MKLTVEQLFASARTKLVLQNPFFATVLLRLPIEEEPRVPTMATDGYGIMYNRKWVESKDFTPAQMVGVLAHEVLHLVFLHHTRCGTRDRDKWNMAADFAINGILKDNKFELPGDPRNLAELKAGKEGWLFDPQFAGQSAEQIYEKMPDPPKSYTQGGGNFGAVNPPSGKDKDGQEKSVAGAEAEAKIMAASAMHAAKLAGKMPASLERVIEDLFEEKIDWREELIKFFQRTKITEETWRRPQRKFIHQGMYLPSPLKEPTGDIVVVVDTSGSIGGPELDAFATEMKAIYAFVKPEKLYVMYCDAAVGKVEVFEPGQGDELEIKPVGGGGTDFKPPFAWLEKHGITPEAFVYLTDGYGDFGKPADFPVLWVINNNQVKPPWGKHLVLDMND